MIVVVLIRLIGIAVPSSIVIDLHQLAFGKVEVLLKHVGMDVVAWMVEDQLVS